MSVSEFIEHFINSPSSDNGAADAKPLLYLKDWHFVKVIFPPVGSFVRNNLFNC